MAGVESGLYLKVGGNFAAPGTGIVGIKVKPDGTMVRVDSSGNEISLGSGDSWFDAAVASMKTLVPGLLTAGRFEYLKVGHKSNGAIDSVIAVEPGAVGGGLGVASDTTHLKYTSGIWQTPRTDLMAVAFRCKFPAIAVGKTSLVSITLVGAGGNIPFGWDQVTSGTKWVLLPAGGTPVISTVNADALWHTVILTSDGTTIKASVDGTVVATSPDVATLTNTASCVSSFSSASLNPGVIVNRIAYGYIDPT
jgi:hypothetical protein